MARGTAPPPTPAAAGDSKRCAVCGRIMTYRPRWARCWATVRTCSAACRGMRLTADDRALEAAIVALLQRRKTGASICPSEASRAVFGDRGLEARAMQRARYAANRLVAAGRVMVTQKGREVEPSEAKGPIRIVFAHNT